MPETPPLDFEEVGPAVTPSIREKAKKLVRFDIAKQDSEPAGEEMVGPQLTRSR